MTMDKSLRMRAGMVRSRNVLSATSGSTASKPPTAGKRAIAPSAWPRFASTNWP